MIRIKRRKKQNKKVLEKVKKFHGVGGVSTDKKKKPLSGADSKLPYFEEDIGDYIL